MDIRTLGKGNYRSIVSQTITVLKKGGLVIVPSDTVYGLLVDAANEKAVKKLIEFKSRPPGKAISVFVSDFEMLNSYVDVRTIHELSLREILPGPFTIILPSKHKVSRLLESEKGTLGVRIPHFEFIQSFVKQFGRPVTATSANIGGRPPHYSVKTLLRELSNKKKRLIDLVIDAGRLPRNKPSTVIDLTSSHIKIIRKGDVTFGETKKYISKSPSQTKKIAHHILGKIVSTKNDKPIIFIIEGELGVGKTIFVKGLGEYFGIKNIISPTYVVSYEYDIKNSKLVHFDLYNIQDKEEFKYLGIEKYLVSGNVVCFEWGEKSGAVFDLLKSRGIVIFIKMRYKGETAREIEVHF